MWTGSYLEKNNYNKDTWSISLRILIKSKLYLKEYVVTTFRREMNMKSSLLPVHALAVWTDTGPHCRSNELSFLISLVHSTLKVTHHPSYNPFHLSCVFPCDDVYFSQIGRIWHISKQISIWDMWSGGELALDYIRIKDLGKVKNEKKKQ